MKKKSLVFILTSLLFGLIITVGTSRISGLKDSHSNQYCGLNLNRQTGQVTKFNRCAINVYGYPVKYVTSGVSSTVIANQSEYSSYSVGYTSFSRLRFVYDWLLWSVLASGVIAGLGAANKSGSKKSSKKKKN
jgi:hypothetical protein